MSKTRASAVLTTRFLKRDFGMQKFEYLASASATLVPTTTTINRATHVLANGHVALPWHFTKLYPANDWLQHVTQDECKYELCVVSDDGEVLATGGLVNKPNAVCLHSDRDVAALYLEDEPAFRAAVENVGVDLLIPELAVSRTITDSDVLGIAGHTVDDNEEHTPVLVEAKLKGRTRHQTFLVTAEILKQGCCGAPALFDDASCAGIIDGIVPPAAASGEPLPDNDVRQVFADCASLVPADVLHRFITDLEQNSDLTAALASSE